MIKGLRNIRLTILFAVILLIGAAGCDTQDPEPIRLSGIYVLNQGNFNKGNASITVYDNQNDEVEQNAFQNQNQRPLGDVAQSFASIGNKLYAVINNSHKVEVMDPKTLTGVGTISFKDDYLPRYMVGARDGIGYVTNWKGATPKPGLVTIVDLNSFEPVDSIKVGPAPEGIAVAGSRAYVANSGLGSGQTVHVINTGVDEVVDSVRVHDNPTTVAVDESNRVWVVCTGAYNDFNDPDDDTPGRLFLLNGQSGSIIDSLTVGGHPSDLAFDQQKGKAYLLNNGRVQRINMNTLEVEEDAFISGNFNSIDITTLDSTRFYLSDPKDYSQAGEAYIYDLTGAAVDSFKTGLIPGDFFLTFTQ